MRAEFGRSEVNGAVGDAGPYARPRSRFVYLCVPPSPLVEVGGLNEADTIATCAAAHDDAW